MAGRYVKLIGASDLPLPNDPFIQIPSLAHLVRFPRDQFPHEIRKGDELLYYAVGGYKKLFAQVRLTGDPQRDVPIAQPERGIPSAEIFRRWPHAATVDLGPHVDYVEFGPDLWDVNPRLMDEIHQGASHFSISSADFDKAVRLINRGKLWLRTKRDDSADLDRRTALSRLARSGELPGVSGWVARALSTDVRPHYDWREAFRVASAPARAA